MSTIQLRNVPEDLHRRLKARAAHQGRTLSDYILDELKVAADRPTMAEWLDGVDHLPAPEHGAARPHGPVSPPSRHNAD